jgi:hypothetical protein
MLTPDGRASRDYNNRDCDDNSDFRELRVSKRCASRDMLAVACTCVAVPLIGFPGGLVLEASKKVEQLVSGEAVEMSVHEMRHLGLLDAKKSRDLPLLELAVPKELINVKAKSCPPQPLIGIGQTQDNLRLREVLHLVQTRRNQHRRRLGGRQVHDRSGHLSPAATSTRGLRPVSCAAIMASA